MGKGGPGKKKKKTSWGTGGGGSPSKTKKRCRGGGVKRHGGAKLARGVGPKERPEGGCGVGEEGGDTGGQNNTKI